MNTRRVFVVCFAAMLTASAARATGAAAAIQIQQRYGAYELTVPASKLVAVIPRGNLVVQENPPAPGGSPGYFLLEDEAQGLIISGWFEPDPDFPGITVFWEGQLKQWRDGGLPDPQAVSIARISDWDAVIYDMALPFARNSHIRAHFVQAGTWIDLHLSITSLGTAGQNRAKLKSALKAIRILKKE